MGTEYGFPPRYVCRCELVYTRRDWVGVNQGVNQAIRDRRKALIADLEAAPRQKSYWYWTNPQGERIRVWAEGKKASGDVMYKETADKLKLVKSKTVPDYKVGKGGPPTGGGGLPGAVPISAPTKEEIRAFGARIKGVALDSEPATTKVLTDIARANKGVKMEGLPFRIKSSKSMLRKMRKELRENPRWTLTELAETDVNDILRYTMLVEEKKYTSIASNTLTTLKDQGHEILLVKNYWGKPGYKGINAVLRNTQGTKYELQFHTPRSIYVKEKISHPLYEKIRVSTDAVKKAKWEAEMNAAWKSVDLPEGVLRISRERIRTKLPVEVKGTASMEFRDEILKVLDHIPKEINREVYEYGTKIQIGHHMSEIRPDLKGVRPRGWPEGTTWDGANGGYNRSGKSIMATEYVDYGGDWIKGAKGRRIQTVTHEYGHAVDDALEFTKSEEFVKVYAKDVSKLETPLVLGGPSQVDVQNLGYFVQPGGAGAQETFAELFSQIVQKKVIRDIYGQDVRDYFKETYKLLKKEVFKE
jgi:hypothetical protein